MSAPVTAPSAPPGADAPSRQRGSLVVADKVLEKVAAQAASEVGPVSGRSGGFLGIGSDADPTARPRVDATISGGSADLSLAVGIAYPGSIRSAAAELRDHVTRRVEALTGIAVRRVDVDVTFLPLQERTPRGALR